MDMKKHIKAAALASASALVAALLLAGCGKTVSPGDKAGYDDGEEYLSIWVHIIEDTPEGRSY